MAESWLIWDSGPGIAAWNMAADEAMLEASVQLSCPILRFYAWSLPAATFGYFQRYEDVQAMTEIRPLLRRPTGGGLVPHDGDWTYSLAFPAAHPWYRLKAEESYRRVHEWLRASFRKCGLASELSVERVLDRPGQCFAGAERFDLMCRERKIAGAAQRRRKDGLLIQGSVQCPGEVERGDWHSAMLHCASDSWQVTWKTWQSTGDFQERADWLARYKFATDQFIRKK